MNRKVIQITESGIFLCDDGTMWERFTPHAKTSSCGFKEVVKPEWIQVEDVPQPETPKPTGKAVLRQDLEVRVRGS